MLCIDLPLCEASDYVDKRLARIEAKLFSEMETRLNEATEKIDDLTLKVGILTQKLDMATVGSLKKVECFFIFCV